MKKRLIIAASTLAATSGLGLGTVAMASAQTPAAGTKHHELRQDRHERADARLNQAVTDGTITSAQKDAFKAEVKTLRTQEHADGQKPSKTERQADRQTYKTSLETWATSNNFPLSKIFPKL